MLGENIKRIRRERNMTQEELAIRLSVVRQTVSKWEKGLSVPDAALLQRIAEVFDCSVGELLGADIPADTGRNEIAEQLARINEQLAVRNRRSRIIWTVIAALLAIVLIALPLASFFLYASPSGGVSVSMTMMEEQPLYSQDDIERAAEKVMKSFRREFRGCRLESVEYDEEYCMSVCAGLAERYSADEAIVLTSRVETSARTSGPLKPSTRYDAIKWILTRDFGGEWTLRDWTEN